MRRYFPWVAVGGLTFGLCTFNLLAQGEKPLALAKLPVTRVVLTNAGIGYFHREGTIDGTARVELKVNEDDVNDLILTLLSEDAKGTSRSISYDNRAPAEVTLRAFSIDLSENPSIGTLLHQVRGEKVEISFDEKSTVSGSILSVQKPKAEIIPQSDDKPGVVVPPAKNEIEQVNLYTDDGLVSVPLAKIKKVKFVRAELQAEFRQALEALAAARSEGKKSVAVTFHGNGQRQVSIGYVADAPLWKPTYRLTMTEAGPRLQCLAAVENTTDEDWRNVRVKLVSGRPITFKMDLYEPLYVPRPLIEPELYASLRPPLYQGQLSMLGGQSGLSGGISGGIGGRYGIQGAGVLGGQGIGQNLGQGGGVVGIGGGMLGNFDSNMHRSSRNMFAQRLSYDELKERLAQQGKSSTLQDPVAAASRGLGEAFEYAIAEPVSLPRFKSTLLPVLDEKIEAERLSIYNAAILPGYPLKGLRIKNTSKLFLAEGPVTVYENGSAAGQARLPNVKPGESRLVSYAIDLDVTLRSEPVDDVRTPVSAKIADGELRTVTRLKSQRSYAAANKSGEAKTLWVTQPIRDGWKLIAPQKPAEQTAGYYRFEMKLPPGGQARLDVVEESEDVQTLDLAKKSVEHLERALQQPSLPPAVKAALERVKAIEAARLDAQKSMAEETAALKEIVEEQSRLRANLAALPKESDAFKRFVKKFDDQETEIERRRAKVKELEASRDKSAKDLAALLKDLKAE